MTGKGFDDPHTYHAAVLVIGLGQHENILGSAATGGGVTFTEIGLDLLFQIFHDAAEDLFRKRFTIFAGDGQ